MLPICKNLNLKLKENKIGQIIVSMYLSLDGVMEETAWTAPYFNEEVAKFQSDLLFESEALLLG